MRDMNDTGARDDRRARRSNVSARARRRGRGGAGLRRRLPRSAAAREDADLASRPGRHRRPRHLLRPALRAQPRDARRPRSDRHAPGRRRSIDARRDRALHQAVLDQHRPVQQPHVAQVRARVRARRVRRRGARRRTRRRALSAAAGETLDALLARLQPMFFDLDVDPTVTSKTPRARQGHRHRQRQQPLRRRDDGGSRGVRGEAPAELAAGEARRPARRGGLPRRRPLRRADRRDRAAPRSGDSVRDRADGEGAARADHVLPHRRRGRPRGVRHRVGAGQGVARRHDQRLRRGLPRRAQHQGRVGSARVLRQPREDVADPDDRGAGAVVRRPHAVGSEVPQGRRPRRHRQRHRHRHRNGGVGADHAGRHQPAQRSGDPRAVRQQVGVAVERERGLRSLDRCRSSATSSRGRRRKPRDRSGGTPSPAS